MRNKNTEIRPFWEQAYRDPDAVAFAKGPTFDLAEFHHLIPPGSSILDVGCGEGRNIEIPVCIKIRAAVVSRPNFYLLLKNRAISIPALAPSATANATWAKAPVQSPAA